MNKCEKFEGPKALGHVRVPLRKKVLGLFFLLDYFSLLYARGLGGIFDILKPIKKQLFIVTFQHLLEKNGAPSKRPARPNYFPASCCIVKVSVKASRLEKYAHRPLQPLLLQTQTAFSPL